MVRVDPGSEEHSVSKGDFRYQEMVSFRLMANGVAYASNETGRWEIYVTSFPDAQREMAGLDRRGKQPRWRGEKSFSTSLQMAR